MYAKNGALEALLGWLEVRGTKAGPLFVPVDKAGRLEIRRLTTQAIFDRCAYLAEQAGIAPFSPHDLRRTFIGDLLDAGADLATVQKMAGHASPVTTARYDRRDERAKQRAASLLIVPYIGSRRARSRPRASTAAGCGQAARHPGSAHPRTSPHASRGERGGTGARALLVTTSRYLTHIAPPELGKAMQARTWICSSRGPVPGLPAPPGRPAPPSLPAPRDRPAPPGPPAPLVRRLAYARLSIPSGTAGGSVTVSNSLNVTSATKLADATGKGVICIVTSVTVTNIQATAVLYTPTVDPVNGVPFIVTGGIQSQSAAAACAGGTTAWIQTFAADSHRASGAGDVYVTFN